MTNLRGLFTVICVLVPAIASAQTGRWHDFAGSSSGQGISGPTADTMAPVVAMDAQGRPAVAWHSMISSGHQIYFKRWNGAAWEEVGGSASPGGVSGVGSDTFGRISLKFDANGNPNLSWNQSGGVYFKRWNGAAWEEVGGSATGTGISGTTDAGGAASMDLDASGNPSIAWKGYYGGLGKVYFRRWNGSSWEELAGSGTTTGVGAVASRYDDDPLLKVDANGVPYIAYPSTASLGTANAIHLKYWTGSAWAGLGVSATGNGLSQTTSDCRNPSLGLDSTGTPIVAFSRKMTSNTDIYWSKWNGTSWTFPSAVATTAQDSFGPVMVVDPSDNPMVAWTENWSTSYHTFFRRYNGTSWVEFADPSHAPAVSSNSPSRAPSLAVDANGLPCLAWHGDDYTSGAAYGEIYVRKWWTLLPDGLEQLKADGTTPIAVGGATDETSMIVRCKSSAGLRDGDWLQVEFRTVASTFTGASTATGNNATGGQPPSASLTLAKGDYHWQACVMTLSYGSPIAISNWIPFGNNPNNEVDVVATTSSTTGGGTTSDPTLGGGGGGGGGGGCSAGRDRGTMTPIILAIFVLALVRLAGVAHRSARAA